MQQTWHGKTEFTVHRPTRYRCRKAGLLHAQHILFLLFSSMVCIIFYSVFFVLLHCTVKNAPNGPSSSPDLHILELCAFDSGSSDFPAYISDHDEPSHLEDVPFENMVLHRVYPWWSLYVPYVCN